MGIELETTWSAHRESVRRLLVGMAHDIDLAEDLLQETYLRAWRGMSGYGGGDARAWLCAIARNVFHSHMRQACVRSEVQADGELLSGNTHFMGSRGHIEQLDVRRLLSRLPDDLRTALVMKHHMGLTYPEIARRTGCAAITARMRVNRAVSMVRATLDECWTPAGSACSGMGTGRILDFLYDLLRPESMEAVDKHLHECGLCRDRVGDVRALVRAMDGLPVDFRQMHLLDVDDAGVPSLHVTSGGHNACSEPMDALVFRADLHSRPRSVAVPGSRLSYDASPAADRPDLLQYMALLPSALPPGHDVGYMTVFGPAPDRRARRVGCRTYRLDWSQRPSDTEGCSYTQVVRLPQGARFTSSDPLPAEVLGNTIIWRSDLLPGERFRSTVEYRLDA